MNNSSNILLLTLVHPDFLPPVYAVAQVLRDEGYNVTILTTDSYVPAEIDLGEHITVRSVGKHHNVGLQQRLLIRTTFTSTAQRLVIDQQPAAIISFCAFTLISGLQIRGKTPVIYHALEIADFLWASLKRSPLSQVNNLLALKRLHKADLLCTPSELRSEWMQKRCKLEFTPHTILNTAYIPKKQAPDSKAVYDTIVPENLRSKKTILYTGAVNHQLCVLELVQAFISINEPDSALLITGIKDNPYCNEIQELVNSSPAADRIKLMPYVTREEMLALQANANIGACLMREDENNEESKMPAPNKVGEYLAKGLYLLSVDNQYMRRFKEENIASLAESPAVEHVGNALRDALSAIEDKNYKGRIQRYVSGFFCMQQQMKPILDFLRR